MYQHSVVLSRISNGYIVSVPKSEPETSCFPPELNPAESKQSAPELKPVFFIPKDNNTTYCESLEKVFEFLKSIESAIPYGSVVCRPSMLGRAMMG